MQDKAQKVRNHFAGNKALMVELEEPLITNCPILPITMTSIQSNLLPEGTKLQQYNKTIAAIIIFAGSKALMLEREEPLCF